jgi:hypothetical protein
MWFSTPVGVTAHWVGEFIEYDFEKEKKIAGFSNDE